MVSDSLESLLDDEEDDSDSELDSDELELWKVMCNAPEDDFLVTALSWPTQKRKLRQWKIGY